MPYTSVSGAKFAGIHTKHLFAEADKAAAKISEASRSGDEMAYNRAFARYSAVTVEIARRGYNHSMAYDAQRPV